ncbi:uncharacterized protein LOC143530630 [Bidens hawaiensis]|uniref:uncharacterized protein LOC143530630 n=1 Tax=Bidens hawaiensis TaxID=980011 RepID=UPI00404B7CE1
MRSGSMGGHTSPYMLPGTKQLASDNISEPTSPKVTCAGQIKVRPSTRSCKTLQTVMEEIERLHNNRKKKPTWMEALGFKKEVMQFLSCLRSIKFDFRCLGAFSHVDITSDDEEDDEDNNNINPNDQDHQDHDHNFNEEVSPQTMFSKWFMVLQENQDCGVFEKDEKSLKTKDTEDQHPYPCLPPTNALLLMRCRSAPAKSWMEEKEEEEQQQKKYSDDHDQDDYQEHEENEEQDDKDQKLELPKESKRNSLSELMKNESDFYKLSVDVAKETWVTGGIHKDPFSRSRSWRR